ncbi:hypothetical protein D3C75_891260 [compost metagenome]
MRSGLLAVGADLALLHAVDDHPHRRIVEVAQHPGIAIAVASHQHRAIALLFNQHVLDADGLARPVVEVPVRLIASGVLAAFHRHAQADHVLRRHAVSVMRIAREHAYHIVDRGGADIDVDAVGAQRVH